MCKYNLLFWALFIGYLKSFAQFTGGNADGYGDGLLIQSTCPQLVSDFVFNGGNADGYGDGLLIQSACPQLVSDFVFTGGNADGYSDGLLIQSACPQLVANFVFNGGNADGYSDGLLTQTSCQNLIADFVYYGGNADGYSGGLLTQSNCPQLVSNFVFYGGNADGNAFAKTILGGQGTWLGLTNAWSATSNWCAGLIPTSTTDVNISTGVPFQPQLSTNSFCNDLNIGIGAALTLNGQRITVSGAFGGTGTIIGSTTSSMTIVGTGNAGTYYMSNATASSKTLSNLTLNRTSSGSVTLGDTLYLSTDLTLSNGTLNTAGKLRLLSTATKTARIGQVTGTGNISGNVIAEKFAPAGSTGWANIGNSVNNDILLN
ncbi:MAG: hypothetical protein ACK48W_04015, partial [Bacteroidota bacterium]